MSDQLLICFEGFEPNLTKKTEEIVASEIEKAVLAALLETGHKGITYGNFERTGNEAKLIVDQYANNTKGGSKYKEFKKIKKIIESFFVINGHKGEVVSIGPILFDEE